jgi:hypothetical protein
MKGLKFFWLIAVIFVMVLSAVGCAPQNTPETFTNDLAAMILEPVQQVNKTEKTYSDDLQGSLGKLVDSKSYSSEMTIQVEDITGAESLGSGAQLLNGAKLDFESAYDVKTGDTLLAFNGMGLVNGSVALHEGALSLDIPQFLKQLMILEYDSTLDFSKPILLQDRIKDLMMAINPEAASSTETQAQLEELLYKYAGLIASKITKDQLSVGDDTLDILGVSTKVQKVTLTLDEDALREIIRVVLETAVDDDQLYNFVTTNIPSSVTQTDPDQMKEQMKTSIQDGLDNLDSTDLAGAEVTIDLFNLRSGKLVSLKKTPIAVNIKISTDNGDAEVFYKYVVDKRQFDIEFKLDSDQQSLDLFITNILEKDIYNLKGELTLSDGTLDMNLDGTTQAKATSEVGEYELSFDYSDGSNTYAATLNLSTELTQVKKGSEYEMTASLSGSTTIHGQEIGAELSMDTTYNFSDDVKVDLPDFEDKDAAVYDNITDFINAIQSSANGY